VELDFDHIGVAVQDQGYRKGQRLELPFPEDKEKLDIPGHLKNSLLW
jgi:hypothetical protein